MLRKQRVDECAIGVEKIEHRTILADNVDEESQRLFEHRPAELVREAGEALAVDAVVLFEAAKLEPVAGELGGQPAHAVVAQHPPRLGDDYRRLMQVACGSM